METVEFYCFRFNWFSFFPLLLPLILSLPLPLPLPIWWKMPYWTLLLRFLVRHSVCTSTSSPPFISLIIKAALPGLPSSPWSKRHFHFQSSRHPPYHQRGPPSFPYHLPHHQNGTSSPAFIPSSAEKGIVSPRFQSPLLQFVKVSHADRQSSSVVSKAPRIISSIRS